MKTVKLHGLYGKCLWKFSLKTKMISRLKGHEGGCVYIYISVYAMD